MYRSCETWEIVGSGREGLIRKKLIGVESTFKQLFYVMVKT